MAAAIIEMAAKNSVAYQQRHQRSALWLAMAASVAAASGVGI